MTVIDVRCPKCGRIVLSYNDELVPRDETKGRLTPDLPVNPWAMPTGPGIAKIDCPACGERVMPPGWTERRYRCLNCGCEVVSETEWTDGRHVCQCGVWDQWSNVPFPPGTEKYIAWLKSIKDGTA